MAAAPRQPKPIAALLALSLLGALGSLRGDLWPGPFRAAAAWPPLERQALAWAEMAACAGLLALVRRRGITWASAREAALAGLGLFAAPALLAALAGPWVDDLTRVAIIGLTPVLAVVLEPYIGTHETGRAALGAALAAVAGMLLVFPVTLPATFTGALALGAVLLASLCVAAANARAVGAAKSGGGVVARAAVAALAAAIALACAGLATEHWTGSWISPRGFVAQAAWVAAVDLPALLLLFWLTERMTAAQMTLRFVLAPLLAGVAGIALFLPSVSGRAAAGLALMAAGAVWMLTRSGDAEAKPGLGLGGGQID